MQGAPPAELFWTYHRKKGGGVFHITGIGARDPDFTDDKHFYTAFCSKHEIIRLRDVKTSQDYLLRLRTRELADLPAPMANKEANRGYYHPIH